MNSIRRNRRQQLLDVGALYIEAANMKGIVSKAFVRELAGYRPYLKAMRGDEDLREIAAKTLEIVDEMLIYIKTRDQRNLDRVGVLHNECDALIYALLESGESDRH